MSSKKADKFPGPVNLHIAGRLRQCRVRMGFSAGELDIKIGAAANTVAKFESADRRIDARNLFLLSGALGVGVRFFFDGLQRKLPDEVSIPLSPDVSGEASQFVREYYEVADPKLRKSIFNFVKSVAKSNGARDAAESRMEVPSKNTPSHNKPGGALDLERVQDIVSATGLTFLGVFHPGPGDGVAKSAKTLVMAGNAGPGMWEAFSAKRPKGANPLDAWTRRILDKAAREFGAEALYEFDGPPYHPFAKWAEKTGNFHPSPLGIMIHEEYGLWHAYRGALLFKKRLALPHKDKSPSPCKSCKEKPCLSICPVGAFGRKVFDAALCASHVASPKGGDCMECGCIARLSCPVGTGYIYVPGQARFHMEAFLNTGHLE